MSTQAQKAPSRANGSNSCSALLDDTDSHTLSKIQWGTCRLNGTVPEMNEQLGPAVLEGVVSTYRLLVDVVAFYLVISGLYIANLESNDLKVLFYEDKSSKMCTFMYSTEWTCRLFLETWPLTR